MESDDDYFEASDHRLPEMMATDSDLELAFRLQLQEAMDASLATATIAAAASSSSVSTLAVSLQTLDLDRVPQEKRDIEQYQAEMRRVTEELLRRDHDAQFAREIERLPSDQWDDYGDEFEPQEAMDASLATATIASASSSSSVSLQTLDLDRVPQEKRDIEQYQAEMCRVTEELLRRDHDAQFDAQFAREIERLPSDQWDDYGDEFERPIESSLPGGERPYRLYFKGMEGKNFVMGAWVQLAAIGVAVCDPEDRPVLQIQKPVTEGLFSREGLEVKALTEGLNAVISLGIKRVQVYTDFRTLYNHITGKWIVKQRKVADLIDQLLLLRKKVGRFHIKLLPRSQVKFVFKLAKDAIYSQITDSTGNKVHKETCHMETCNICLEDTDTSQMFAVDVCLHRYCFSCMKQHVEVKLLNGMLPGCPHEGCKAKLSVESSRMFLPPKLLDIMIHRLKEASIPVTEKVYCPYPKCSALMSRSEAICPQQNSSNQSGLRKCIKCSGSFCIKCKVPWHDRMSCYEYKKSHPKHHVEESGLQVLAKLKLWRQCVKCNHMIELAEGCFHMTCRCGYEFCYTCGAEWRDKKATCSCPLWHEDYILDDNSEDEDWDSSNYDDDDDYDDYDDDDDDDVFGWL